MVASLLKAEEKIYGRKKMKKPKADFNLVCH